MTTRFDLRVLCRRRLGDEAEPLHWSDLQIEQWINDAIADYSIHFPRRTAAEISCEAGVREYELPAGFRGALRVEYPLGEDPPRDLRRRSSAPGRFWTAPRLYDLCPAGDETARALLRISDRPADGETIRVEYLADHAWLDDDADLSTVPDRDLELVVLFVRWKALEELAATEARSPDPTTLALSTLGTEAMRAERAYRAALAAAQEAEGEAGWVAWGG